MGTLKKIETANRTNPANLQCSDSNNRNFQPPSLFSYKIRKALSSPQMGPYRVCMPSIKRRDFLNLSPAGRIPRFKLA